MRKSSVAVLMSLALLSLGPISVARAQDAAPGSPPSDPMPSAPSAAPPARASADASAVAPPNGAALDAARAADTEPARALPLVNAASPASGSPDATATAGTTSSGSPDATATAGATPSGSPDATARADAPTEAAEESEQGLTVGIGVSSAYVWRGANQWGPDTASQNLGLFPGLVLYLGAFYVGYWGAYQLTGETRGANVEGGVGAEQDLYVGYDWGISEELSLGLLATYYFYPFAREAESGVRLPMYAEPALSVAYSTFVELGASLSYYRGLQDATDGGSHVYVTPSVSQSFELATDLSLDVAASGGYKLWTSDEADTADGNNWDVQGSVGATYMVGALSLAPAGHVSFTDAGEGAKASDGLAVWGSLDASFDLGF